MNVLDMLYNFRVEFGGFLQGPNAYEPTSDDILYFLNKAQINFVKNNFSGLNERREGFEQSQRVIDELRVFHKKNIEAPTTYAGISKSGYYIDRANIPSDSMFIISTASNVIYPQGTDAINAGIIGSVRELKPGTNVYKEIIVDNDFSQSDDIYSLLSDPFNTTKKTSPLTDINEDYINVYTDKTFFVDKIFINYIREPQKIIFIDKDNGGNKDCELPDFVHTKIVEDAVNLLLLSLSKLSTNNNTN